MLSIPHAAPWARAFPSLLQATRTNKAPERHFDMGSVQHFSVEILVEDKVRCKVPLHLYDNQGIPCR